MLNKAHQILRAPFESAFITACVFLLIIIGSLYFSRQLNQPLTLIKSFIVKPLVQNPKHEVIGFLPSWNAAKEVKVHTSQLTQLIFFGFGVNDQGEIIKYDSNNNLTAEWEQFYSPYFKKIRQEAKNNNTKILIAIKNFDNKNIDKLISNPILSEKFANQLTEILTKENLDGVNMDFEYFTDSNFPTFKHFNNFFANLSQKIKQRNPNLIVSADFSASVVSHDPAYDMVKLGDILDQIILMGYDYSTPNSTYARPVAPLYSSVDKESIDSSITAMKGRVPIEKIILAIPFYGYEWQTSNSNFNSPTVPGTGALATYQRITDLISQRNDIEVNWDDISQTPWMSYNQSGAIKQIYYDNSRSLSKKLEYIKQKKLAGVGIWAIGYEGDNEIFWELISKFIK